MAKIKWLFIALTLIIIVFLLNTNQQSKLGSNSDQIFGIEKEDIFIIDISKANQILLIFLLQESLSW